MRQMQAMPNVKSFPLTCLFGVGLILWYFIGLLGSIVLRSIL